ncbi:MAG: hypothetical protein V1722_04850 [Candidatus Micrarchaeota archaeon]
MTVTRLVCQVSKTRDSQNTHALRFDLFLGSRRPANVPGFSILLNKLQATKLEKLQADKKAAGLGDKLVGYAHLHLEPRKTIRWTAFRPFGSSIAAVRNVPTRYGIGTIVHGAITEYLAKQYPRHRIRHDAVVSWPRQQQLTAMGIASWQFYPMKTYARTVRQYTQMKNE